MDEHIKISDLGLATTLETLGFHILKLEKDFSRDNLYFFLFEKTRELEKIIQKYWSGDLEVEPKKFWQECRDIKSRINSIK